ncbi:MAG: glycosyltransferase family 9 protein, partial [Nitrospirota bacterium]|nr:glycosyltransferase family 9 protein [Nitrospirota bacterium]
KVLLFGAPSEKELGMQISSMMKEKNINLVGETTLSELIGLVKRCELLITNDTGTMHIAAATGTKIVGLFLVHAFAPETGPYSEGNIILQPDMECFPCYHNTTCPHYACLEKITPEEVAQASRMIEELQDRPDLNIDAATFPEKVVVTSHFDEANFIWFRPLKKCEPQSHNILALMYRYFFISQAAGGLKDNYWLEKLNKNYLAWTPEKAEEWTGKVQERFRKLANAASRGLKLISDTEAHLKKGRIDKVKEKGEEIVAVDREIDILGHAHAELRPLTRLFELGKENLVDKDVGMMLAKTKVLYKGILLGTAGMIRIIGVWGDNSRKNNSMETAKGSL